MEPFDAWVKAMEYNKANEKFAPLDDDTLGERFGGGFVKHMYNGRWFDRYIFDNGDFFLLDVENQTLYYGENIPNEYFIHKYLEKIIYDLKQNHLPFLDQDEKEVEPYCSCNEIMLQSSIVVRLLPYRDKRIVYLTNILLPPQLRGQGLGIQLISKVYSVCKNLGYKLLIVDMVETFYNRMVQRGATVIKEHDIVEITDKTNLGHL